MSTIPGHTCKADPSNRDDATSMMPRGYDADRFRVVGDALRIGRIADLTDESVAWYVEQANWMEHRLLSTARDLHSTLHPRR